MSSESAITPREAKLLVRYLDSVDKVVAARLAVGFSPHEDHLTALLCEMLDADLSALHTLDYPLAALRQDLGADTTLLSVDFKIETRKYPPHIERRLTSADLGVIVEYRDYLAGAVTFTRGALFQAKRLYSGRPGQPYSLDDSFREFDVDQLERLVALEEETPLGPDDGPRRGRHPGQQPWCHYLFYCPASESYDKNSRERVRRLCLPNDDIFDYAKGWHLYEYASSPSRPIPGLVVSQPSWLINETRSGKGKQFRPKAREVFERFWGESQPFSWFLVYDMLRGRAGTSADSALRVVRGQAPTDTEQAPLLPRYVLTVRVQFGQG